MVEKTKEFWRKIWEREGAKEKGKEIAIYTLMSSFWIFLLTVSFWYVLLYIPVNIGLRLLPKKLDKFWFRLFVQTLACSVVWITSGGFLGFFCFVLNSIMNKSFVLAKKKKEWIVGGLIPVAVLMIAEFLQKNFRLFFWRYLILNNTLAKFGAFVTLILVFLVSWMLITIFNNKKIGYCVSISLFMLLSIVNFFVVAFTEQPFTLSDLKIAVTAAGVLSEQQLTAEHWIRLFFALVMIAALYTVIILVYKEKREKRKITKTILSIPVFCAVVLSMAIGSKFLYQNLLLFRGNLMYGFISNFYITIDAGLDIPENAKDYVIEDKNDELTSNPNVIIIMNEAFSDLGTLYNLSLNEDPLEYYHSLIKEYPNGITYSSVRGNNTCSSEWELLSSTPTALTTKGATIYQDNCIPMRSLVSLFNSRGYTTVGLHPYHAVGYNRNNVYKTLGFDESYFLEDLPEPIDTVRNYATDEYDYKQLIRLYEENESKGDSPFFCFNITMQNHGGYTSNQLNSIYRTEGTNYSDLNTYLSVLDKSDDALETLISYFENVEEDTVILLFGDHHPLLPDSFYEEVYGKNISEFTAEELMSIYSVPYLIWANYDLNKDAAPAETSNNYLANILFNVGNIPKSTWLHMVDEWQEEYPVITMNFTKDATGFVDRSGSILKTMPKSLQEYQNYSYGILHGLKE